MLTDDQIYNKLDFLVCGKNKNHKYIYANEKITQLMGLDSPAQLIGKTDYESYWHKYAELYVDGDCMVMNGKQYINVIEPFVIPTKKETLKCLVTRSSIFNQQNECAGTIISILDVTNYFIQKKSINFITNGKNFCLGEYFGNEILTKREVDVLKGILLGYSIKYIAKLLNISPRTVETHLINLKQKLQCRTKGDIIVTAIKTGLNFTVLDADNWMAN